MWKRLATVLTAMTAAFLLTGAGLHRPVTSGPENAAAARAVAAMTDQSDQPLKSALPLGFAAVMGYRPEIQVADSGQEHLIKPTGACSSPVGDAWSIFMVACQSHDLGYDLLRYAAVTGGELGPWARRAIDDQLARDMRSQCAVAGDAKCDALVVSAAAGVRFNSWRQGYGVPIRENGVAYGMAAALLVTALLVPLRTDRWMSLGERAVSIWLLAVKLGSPVRRDRFRIQPARSAKAIDSSVSS